MKKTQRLVKNVYILPSTKSRIEELNKKTGFTQGQIVDLAIEQLNEQIIIDKAISVKSIEAVEVA